MLTHKNEDRDLLDRIVSELRAGVMLLRRGGTDYERAVATNVLAGQAVTVYHRVAKHLGLSLVWPQLVVPGKSRADLVGEIEDATAEFVRAASGLRQWLSLGEPFDDAAMRQLAEALEVTAATIRQLGSEGGA